MDVTSIANLATSMSQARAGQEIGIAVLKKAIDISASTATALIDALPEPISRNQPSHLGQNINTTA